MEPPKRNRQTTGAAVLISGMWLLATILASGVVGTFGVFTAAHFFGEQPTLREVRISALYIALASAIFVSGPAVLYWWWRNRVWLVLTLIALVLGLFLTGASLWGAYIDPEPYWE